MKIGSVVRPWWRSALLVAVTLLGAVMLAVFSAEFGPIEKYLPGFVLIGVPLGFMAAGVVAPVRNKTFGALMGLLGAMLFFGVVFVSFAIAVYRTHGRREVVFAPRPDGSAASQSLEALPQRSSGLEAFPLLDADQVTLSTMGDASLVDVRSSTGIGAVTLSPTGETWPTKVTLRLHLRGLEQLRLQIHLDELTASVSSNREPRQIMELKRNKQPAETLTPKSPYWTEIRMVGNDCEPRTEIPLKDGYFELDLPQAVLDDNPLQIVVHWIDFYR